MIFEFRFGTDKLPFSIRYLLESAIRNCDNFEVLEADVEKILDWEKTASQQVEIAFKPARVILQVRKSRQFAFKIQIIAILFRISLEFL